MRSSTKSKGARAHNPDEARVAYGVASILLRYPDERTLGELASLSQVARRLSKGVREGLLEACAHLSSVSLIEAQREYVATFDLQRRCSLHLSYYLNGDTRRRGMALWRFQDVFHRAGQRVEDGELADYLPAVLELAASGFEESALQLMKENRAGLLVLGEALHQACSPYAGVLVSLERLLGPVEPRVSEIAERLVFDGPPGELVGLDAPDAFNPYGTEESPHEHPDEYPLNAPSTTTTPTPQLVTIRTKVRT